jgi:hypothetical protein
MCTKWTGLVKSVVAVCPFVSPREPLEELSLNLVLKYVIGGYSNLVGFNILQGVKPTWQTHELTR